MNGIQEVEGSIPFGSTIASTAVPGRRRHSRAVVVCVLLLGLTIAIPLAWRGGERPSDFAQDYFAAVALRHGESVYGPAVPELARPTFGVPGPANFHPPTVAVAFLPATVLPYRLAFAAFVLLDLGLYLGLLALASRRFRPPGLPAWTLLLAALWWPAWICLAKGQISLPIGAALAAGWLAAERGRSGWAGTLVGLATLLKLFPGLLAVYFLLRRDGRALLAMALTVGSGLALTAAVAGPAELVRYATVAAPEATARWTSHPLNASLWSMAELLFGTPTWGTTPLVAAPQLARGLAGLAAALLLALTLGAGLRRLRHDADGPARLYSALVVASLLLSPLTWAHSMTVAALPLLVELRRAATSAARRTLAVVAFALLGFPGAWLAAWLATGAAGETVPILLTLPFLAPTFGLLILWGRLLWPSSEHQLKATARLRSTTPSLRPARRT